MRRIRFSSQEFEELYDRVLADTLRASVRTLPELERQVIELRYLVAQPMPLDAVARQLGVGPSRVTQLETSALRPPNGMKGPLR